MSKPRNILLTFLLLATSAAQAQEGGDLQAQIEYAYQTEDTNSLANLIQALNTQVIGDGANVSLRYHLAHAQFRFGELHKERRRGPEAAFSDCVDELKPVIDQDVKSPEGLALQSVCYTELADLKTLEAVLLRSRAADRLKSALQLAPRNPRVLLMAAQQDMRHAKPGSPERQRGFVELQQAAQSFEESSGTNPETPGWGHADAYLALGRELQIRGDHLGARNWIEKALLAAPDYKAAQRQMAMLTKP